MNAQEAFDYFFDCSMLERKLMIRRAMFQAFLQGRDMKTFDKPFDVLRTFDLARDFENDHPQTPRHIAAKEGETFRDLLKHLVELDILTDDLREWVSICNDPYVLDAACGIYALREAVIRNPRADKIQLARASKP